MMGGRRAAVAATLGLLATAAPAVAAGDYRTELVSRLGHDGAAADRPVLSAPAVSADGATVAFTTTAGNLPGASGPGTRAFVKSMDSGEIVLASRADGADGAGVEAGPPAISASGRHVCWVSPLVPALAPESGRLMVRDIVDARTYVVPGSVTTAGQPPATPGCAVSADGRKVAYATTESHAPDDGDAQTDVYRYDLSTGTAELASIDGDAGSGPGALGPAQHAVMTPDGRHVAFTAHAYPPGNQYSPAGTAPSSSVFVRDFEANALRLVSRPDGCDGTTPPFAEHAGAGSRWPAISDDGRLVAFQSGFLLDDDAPAPPLARDTDAAFHPIQVYLREIARCETHMVSRVSGAHGKAADDEAIQPALSGDGRYVAFTSYADNLDPDVRDSRNRTDVFVRDWRDGRTALVSRASGLFGPPANARSGYPAISRRGRTITFGSQADNLTETPTGNVQIYRRETVPPRRKLAADLPGKPLARAAYRGGRSGRDKLVVELSEAARVRLTVVPVTGDRRGVVRRLAGIEGRNRIPLRAGLRAGWYTVMIAARDFNHEESLTTSVIRVGRRR